MRSNFIFVFGLLCWQMSVAGTPDSLLRKTYSLVISPRFNTLNMAPISGTIVNRHVNVDVAAVYIKNRFMVNFQNAVDLEDTRSEMNYFFINARYRLNLTKELSVSPFIAFYSEHAHRLFDIGSDANGGMLFSYQKDFLTVEAFALFIRLTNKNTIMDAVNRLEIKYKLPSLTMSCFVYHNARYFDDRERLCLGFRAQLPEFRVLSKIPARTDVTGSFKIYENKTSSTLSGVFLSLIFPISVH